MLSRRQLLAAAAALPVTRKHWRHVRAVRGSDTARGVDVPVTVHRMSSPPAPGAGTTIFGMRSAGPALSNWVDGDPAHGIPGPFTDLDPYRLNGAASPTTPKSPTQMLTIVEDEFSGYVGAVSPLFGISSVYNSSGDFSISGIATTIMNMYGRLHLYVSTDPWTLMSSPSAALLSSIDSMIASVPADGTLYVAFENEPSGDVGTKGTTAQYRAAAARFALEIKNRKGAKNIVACTSYTRDSLAFASNALRSSTVTSEWNLVPEMQALGLDPATDILMAQHGYTVNTDQASELFSQRFFRIFDLYRSWGLERFAIGENAAQCRQDVRYLAMSNWLDDMAQTCADYALEFYIYFYSGGSGGSVAVPDGHWITGAPYSNTTRALTNQHKIHFAQIAQAGGPIA